MDQPLEMFTIKLKCIYSKRKSKVWEHFGTLWDKQEHKSLEENMVFCKQCFEEQLQNDPSMIFSSANIQGYSKNCSTGNLSRHLKRDHNIGDMDSSSTSLTTSKIISCHIKQEDNADDTDSSSVFLNTHFLNKSVRKKSARNRKTMLGKELVLWMAKDLLPFHIISNSGIKDFLTKYEVVAADNDIPDYKALSTALIDVYESTLKVVTRKVSGQKHFALTFDLWTDHFQRRSYITFKFHFLSTNFEMECLTLETKYIAKSNFANNILNELEEVTDMFNLELACNYVVFDQRTNIKKAMDIGCINNNFCLGHGLDNLLHVDGYNSVPEIKDLILKCKSIVRALRFKTHVLRTHADALQNEILSNIENLEELFESEDASWVDYDDEFLPLNDPLETNECSINDHKDLYGQNVMNKTNITLTSSVPTRWHSILAMLDSLGCETIAINKLLINSNNSHLILLESEALVLYKLRDFLQKFKDAVNIMSGEAYPSICLALIIRSEIMSILIKNEHNNVNENDFNFSQLSLIDQMKTNIKSKLNCRFPITDILVCASLLDPRFSSLDCVLEYCKTQNLTKVEFLIKMYNELIGDVQETNDDQNNSNPSPSDRKILKLVQQHCTNFKNTSLETECHLLLRFSSSQDVLTFWREKAFAMPLLTVLAQKVLCIPATSIPSERVFSHAGLTISNKRCQLSPRNVNKILFIHDNYDRI